MLRTVQNEVELLARTPARIGGQTARIGVGQSRRLHEQVKLVIPPVGVEVPGDDHGFAGLAHQIVQRAQLVLAVPVFERQMHQEDRDVVQLKLYDEPLDAGVEVMESFAADPGRSEKRIRLLAHDGHQLIQRGYAVLALEGGVMAERAGDELRLVDHSRAD